ncbi:MAG: FAD:protein FMN transferase [Bacteroidota bacterium]
MTEFKVTERLMGSQFELIIDSEDEGKAQQLLQSGIEEIKRIEDLFSEFRPHTDTSKINQNAGITPITTHPEVLALIERSIAISALTQGAFDISMGPLKKIYKFKNDTFNLPEQQAINQALSLVGYNKIKINKESRDVFLPKEGMAISFAAIGKGYAADCVKKQWISKGVTSGVISASGDLTTIGKKADGNNWTIGIANPDNRADMLFYVPVNDSSVATSGDYEQYFMYDGIRYSHNINPITGKPVTGIKSVSVFSPAAELSDALATAIYIMGIDAGLHLINQLPDTHCIIIDHQKTVTHSKKMSFHHEN